MLISEAIRELQRHLDRHGDLVFGGAAFIPDDVPEGFTVLDRAARDVADTGGEGASVFLTARDAACAS